MIRFAEADENISVRSYHLSFLMECAATAIPLSRLSTGTLYVYFPASSATYEM